MTPYGKFIRKLRIDRGMRLKEMADLAKKSSAYLSAVESGRKPITPQFITEITALLKLNLAEVHQLQRAVDESNKQVTIEFAPQTDIRGRSMVAMLARRINSLDSARIDKIQKLLMEDDK